MCFVNFSCNFVFVIFLHVYCTGQLWQCFLILSFLFRGFLEHIYSIYRNNLLGKPLIKKTKTTTQTKIAYHHLAASLTPGSTRWCSDVRTADLHFLQCATDANRRTHALTLSVEVNIVYLTVSTLWKSSNDYIEEDQKNI